MTGQQLLDKYTTPLNTYGQVLMTIHINVGDSIFPLLVKAEQENKKLDIKAFKEADMFLHDELTVDDIIFV